MVSEPSTLTGAQRILLVDGNGADAAGMLRGAGFAVHVAASGEEALSTALDEFHVVLLELVLPGLSGLEVCRRIRAASAIPVLIVTSTCGEVERVLGLEAGADDFVSRPVCDAELVARIRAIMRRRELNVRSPRTFVRRVGSLELDLLAQTASLEGRPVDLTPTEFRLLALLAAEPERTFTRSELSARLSRSSYIGDERAFEGHVKNLRRKLEADPARPRRVVTVRGVGYMLRAA
jgi:DNA-binding response OmpR family regulator